MRNRWTDFLPIVLPTEERVEKMLKGTSVARDRIIGKLRPTAYREFWEFDVEKVAVNAVMAGARPEYLPVILAMLASGVTARSSSTTSFATISVVNGPIRDEIGMNSGIGALGPYNHANTAIGRAYSLGCQNLQGGSVPGETYMGSLGNNLAYTCCFPEAEERSPWPAFHVDHGFRKTDSTVSVFFGGWYTQSGCGPRDSWQAKFIRCLTAAEYYIQPLIVMDPIAARGFDAWLFQTEADRLVCGERTSARTGLLGRPVDQYSCASTCGGRHRTLRQPAQSRARRDGAAVRAGGHQDRRHRRRNTERVQDVRRPLRGPRTGDL